MTFDPMRLELGVFQRAVQDWTIACFGIAIASDVTERADRFIEEALELAQTTPGWTKERAHALVDYVFAREVGEPGQEIGGVMVTLAALCNARSYDMRTCASHELTRVWGKLDAIRAKQRAKPTGSALPVASPVPVPEPDAQATADLIAAARRFVARVEAGEVRSRATYSTFKDILSRIDAALPGPAGCHPSHDTRVSDASSFDEICVHCGATDGIGTWGELAKPCPAKQPEATREALTGGAASTVGVIQRGDGTATPVRRMKVTRELAHHVFPDSFEYRGRVFKAYWPDRLTRDVPPADAFLYVLDGVYGSAPIFTFHEWPENRQGTRFDKISLWEHPGA